MRRGPQDDVREAARPAALRVGAGGPAEPATEELSLWAAGARRGETRGLRAEGDEAPGLMQVRDRGRKSGRWIGMQMHG